MIHLIQTIAPYWWAPLIIFPVLYFGWFCTRPMVIDPELDYEIRRPTLKEAAEFFLSDPEGEIVRPVLYFTVAYAALIGAIGHIYGL